MNLEEALEASVTEDVVTINDSTIVVNNDLRTMSIPEKVSILGVESDESVNRLKFRLPRYYCDLDLGEFNIYVNYLNGRTEDIYVVTDKKTTSEYVEFSWLVGRNAFKNKGYTKFVLCLKKSGSDGTVIKEFNTTVHKLEVLEGLETEVDTSSITQNTDLNDLIDQIKIMIDLEGKKVISNLPKDYQKLTNEVKTLKDETNRLKEDLDNSEERNIDPLNKAVFGTRKLLLATPIDEDWSGCMNEKGEIYAKDKSDRWHKTYKLCSEDTTIKVKDYAGGTVKHCIFLDRSNNVISTTVGAWTQKMLDVSVPSGAKYVVVNATDSADMIVCYTHIFDTDYNVAEKMNDVNIRMNSAEATIGNVKESLNSVTDTVFSEKKYASLKSIEETTKVDKKGTFIETGRANVYIVNTYIGQTLKAKGYSGGDIPLIVFFDSDDKFVSYIDPNMPWNDNVYQDVVVPEGAYKAYVNDNDGGRTIDLQGLQFEKYNMQQELERLEGLIPDSSKISYDLEQAQLQIAKTQRMNDFAYASFDKAYFVLTIDDANKYLPDVYDLCHELNIPLCPAIITGNLNTDYKNDGRTIKDICDLVVADGGEILAHSGKYITSDSTEEDYVDVFRSPKIELEKLGYNVRGIITAGGAGYLSNDIKLDNWSRKYFDYSDQNGVSSSKAYYHPRWWFHDYTMDGAKSYVDTAITNKSFVVVAMHGSDSTDDLEHIDHVRELLQYIISKGTDKIVFTTWADVYDTFGSTVLEERIKALEEKVSK